MRQVFLLVCGFIVALACQSLFGTWSFYALAASYGLALFLLFYDRPDHAAFFLGGLTVGMELIGTDHFGVATVLAAVILALHHLFFARIKLTSAFSRFAVCLALALTSYALLLYPISYATLRLTRLGIFYLPLSVAFYLLTQKGEPTPYELI